MCWRVYYFFCRFDFCNFIGVEDYYFVCYFIQQCQVVGDEDDGFDDVFFYEVVEEFENDFLSCNVKC